MTFRTLFPYLFSLVLLTQSFSAFSEFVDYEYSLLQNTSLSYDGSINDRITGVGTRDESLGFRYKDGDILKIIPASLDGSKGVQIRVYFAASGSGGVVNFPISETRLN